MNYLLLKKLQQDSLLTAEEVAQTEAAEKVRPVSLNYELTTILSVGILLLASGLGILVYKNLDTIGHLAIIALIGLVVTFCFAWCLKKAPPFTPLKSLQVNIINDYVLLLGCSLLLIFIGYIQFQYRIFGNRWGLASFIPMIILFAAAYYFDHLGVLSMAIINLAAWAGLTITPLEFFKNNDFSSDRIIFTGYALGILLLGIAYQSLQNNIKAHFYFTYKNFGSHLLYLAAISAVFSFQQTYLWWFLLLLAFAATQFVWGRKEKSFYFLVVSVLYTYIAVSYVVTQLLFSFSTDYGEAAAYVVIFYFILSCIGLVNFLIQLNRQLKR